MDRFSKYAMAESSADRMLNRLEKFLKRETEKKLPRLTRRDRSTKLREANKFENRSVLRKLGQTPELEELGASAGRRIASPNRSALRDSDDRRTLHFEDMPMLQNANARIRDIR